MAQILIRGLEEQIVVRLKALARSNGRSLEAEMRELAVRHAGLADRKAAHEEILRIRAALKKRGGKRKGPDSVQLVREFREQWNR